MKQVQVTTRSPWRRWLAENHDQETDGIWLIYTRKETGRPSLEKEESVEEARWRAIIGRKRPSYSLVPAQGRNDAIKVERPVHRTL
jgi:hypothetical protein